MKKRKRTKVKGVKQILAPHILNKVGITIKDNTKKTS